MEFVYCKNLGNSIPPKEYRGVRVAQSTAPNEAITMMKYIVMRAKSIDVLFIWGSCLKEMFVVKLYKLLNPQGKVVIFGDMELPQAEEFNRTDFLCPNGLKGVIKRYFTDFLMNNSTYIVANTAAYNEMKKLCDRHKWIGLLHFYPCIDDEKVREYGIVRKPWEEKENIMLCVGRIGCHQKNTEMLLDALKSVDLKDWKIYMLGPVTSSFDLNEGGDFQKVIDKFFIDYPQFKDKLIFTGMVYDQKKVFEYYNRAKVLLSTSRHEGFANVYSQAAAFGCYVISTDVGGADIGSNNWQFGTKIEQENFELLAEILQNIVDDKIGVKREMALSVNDISYSYRVKNVLFSKIGLIPVTNINQM